MFNEFLMQQELIITVLMTDVVTGVNCLQLPRVAALKVDLVYLRQEGSRDQVLLDVRLWLGLLQLLA